MPGGFLEEGTFGCDVEEVLALGAHCELLQGTWPCLVAHIPTAWHTVGV